MVPTKEEFEEWMRSQPTKLTEAEFQKWLAEKRRKADKK